MCPFRFEVPFGLDGSPTTLLGHAECVVGVSAALRNDLKLVGLPYRRSLGEGFPLLPASIGYEARHRCGCCEPLKLITDGVAI